MMVKKIVNMAHFHFMWLTQTSEASGQLLNTFFDTGDVVPTNIYIFLKIYFNVKYEQER